MESILENIFGLQHKKIKEKKVKNKFNNKYRKSVICGHKLISFIKII